MWNGQRAIPKLALVSTQTCWGANGKVQMMFTHHCKANGPFSYFDCVLTSPLFAHSTPSSAITISTSTISITTCWNSILLMEMQPLHQLQGGNDSGWSLKHNFCFVWITKRNLYYGRRLLLRRTVFQGWTVPIATRKLGVHS